MRIENILKLRCWKWILLNRLNRIFFFLLCFLITHNLSVVISNSTFLFTTVFVISFFSFCMVLNDLIDKENDLKVGKVTGIHYISFLELALLLSILLILSFSSAFFLAGLKGILLCLLGLLSTICYSYFPRVKGKGILGPFFNSFTELVPFLLLLTSLSFYQPSSIFFLLFYYMVGITELIAHQIEDFSNDKKCHICTLPVLIGKRRAFSFLKFFSLLSFFFYTIFIILMSSIFLPFILILPLSILIHIWNTKRFPLRRNEIILPLFFEDIINIGLFQFSPLYLTFFLIFHRSYFLFIFLIFISEVKILRNFFRFILRSIGLGK